MSDSSPNDVSRRRKRDPAGTRPCPERDSLRSVLENIQQQLDELVTEEFAAFQANDQARFWRLNRDMEPMHEERTKAEDALRRHIRTHHCEPLGPPLP